MTERELNQKLRSIERCCRVNACDIDAINDELSEIQVVISDHETRITILEGSLSTVITVVANYSALPDPATVPGEFYFTESPQGTRWLPGSLGGTYYPGGVLYYSNGVAWVTGEIPWNAPQATVDLGLDDEGFVTSVTLANATTVSHPGHTHVAADVTDFVTEARTAVVTNGINNGVTDKAPSEDAVFDALAGKSATGHTHTTADITDIANTKLDIFGITIAEGGVVSTGIKGRLIIPYAGTITGWTILEVSEIPITGDIVIDVKLGTYANYDTTPVFASIAGTEKPTLSSAVANQDLTLTTWTTSFSAGDLIEFTVDSAATVEKVYLAIHTTRT